MDNMKKKEQKNAVKKHENTPKPDTSKKGGAETHLCFE